MKRPILSLLVLAALFSSCKQSSGESGNESTAPNMGGEFGNPITKYINLAMGYYVENILASAKISESVDFREVVIASGHPSTGDYVRHQIRYLGDLCGLLSITEVIPTDNWMAQNIWDCFEDSIPEIVPNPNPHLPEVFYVREDLPEGYVLTRSIYDTSKNVFQVTQLYVLNRNVHAFGVEGQSIVGSIGSLSIGDGSEAHSGSMTAVPTPSSDPQSIEVIGEPISNPIAQPPSTPPGQRIQGSLPIQNIEGGSKVFFVHTTATTLSAPGVAISIRLL